MGGLLKFVIILLGVGWLLGQLIRYFLRTKLAKFARQVNEAAWSNSALSNKLLVLRIRLMWILSLERKSKSVKKDIEGGEYVDYEEVKE